MAPDLSAIIISLNSRRFLSDCLRSLKSCEWRNTTYELIVADNGSTDGTLEMLAAEHPDVRVVANKTNLGYCKAGNQGAEIAFGRHFFFLNDDILILGDAIPRLVEFLDANPGVGMTGSRLLNLDGTDQYSSGRAFTSPMNALFSRKSPLTKWFPNAKWARNYFLNDLIKGDTPYEVDWISAAAMMVERKAFYESGQFAEDYYYFHEQIICDRMKRAGYKIFLDPQSKIIHYEGMGSGLRTRRIRRLHIQRFHMAAHRWYCHHHRIGRFSPQRFLIWSLLRGRAAFLIGAEYLKPAPAMQKAHAERPEGGVPI